MDANPKILFVLSEDWYFSLHWLKLARAARGAGYTVGVATRCLGDSEVLFRAEGFEVFPLRNFSRRGMNPWREIAAVRELSRIYRAFQPDLIHHFVVKTCLIGTIAARLSEMPLILNANTGGGYIYTGTSLLVRSLRAVITQLFRLVFRSQTVHILLLNEGDRKEFSRLWGVPMNRAWAVLGVPLDLTKFECAAEPDTVPAIVFAGRMLVDKGLADLFVAAKMLRAESLPFRLVLAGDEDPGNPASYTKEQLSQLERDGLIEWRRFERDMPKLYRDTHIVCLPSHREGLGAVLIEAGASGRPAVASDIPGCRDVIRNGETGLLVPPRDPEALASALRRLVLNKELRHQLGKAAKQRIDANFALPAVISRYLTLYEHLLSRNSQKESEMSASQAESVVNTCC